MGFSLVVKGFCLFFPGRQPIKNSMVLEGQIIVSKKPESSINELQATKKFACCIQCYSN